jgi:peptidylprolyl isomerase
MSYGYKVIVYVLVSLALILGGYYLFTREAQSSDPPVLMYGSAEQITNPNPNSNLSAPTQQTIMQATIHTNKGDIVIAFGSSTPNTIANFAKLAMASFYNGVKFHRVISGFMIQGGDPLSKDDAHPERWGTGGPGYTFKDEISPTNHNNKGTIAMANAGPDTNGSQFFINLADNNFLDTKHTVFGQVVKGLDVVEAIGKVKTDSSDRPVEPVIILNVAVNNQ